MVRSAKPGYRSYCHPDTYRQQVISCIAIWERKFADVSSSSGFGKAPGKGLGIAIADYDLDGKIDIAVANDSAPQQLFETWAARVSRRSDSRPMWLTTTKGASSAVWASNLPTISNNRQPDLLINALALQRYGLYCDTANGFSTCHHKPA